MKEINDFVRDRRDGKIYWIVEINYETEIYTLKYMVEAGEGLGEDKKAILGFDFNEVRENFEEVESH